MKARRTSGRLSGGRLALSPRRQVLERLAGIGQNGILARGPLVAADDDVDVERIELDAATDTADLVGGNQGRPGAKERVNDDVATIGEIEERTALCCRRLCPPVSVTS